MCGLSRDLLRPRRGHCLPSGPMRTVVRTAKSASHPQRTIFAIVKALIAIDGVLVCALLLYAASVGLPLTDVIPFALILLVASVPVALHQTLNIWVLPGRSRCYRAVANAVGTFRAFSSIEPRRIGEPIRAGCYRRCPNSGI
jgi:hypothetical protein